MTYRPTPEEHRQMAARLRSLVGHPRAATPERLEQMAQNHETMARVREGQAILAKAGGSIADHKSPVDHSLIAGGGEAGALAARALARETGPVPVAISRLLTGGRAVPSHVLCFSAKEEIGCRRSLLLSRN